jgi:hypothetical protein
VVRYNQIKNRYSLLGLLACYGLMIYAGFFFYPKWTKGGSEATISWDVSGYYTYLPAAFIYKDLRECKFQTEIGEKYSPTPNFESARRYNETSGRIMQYNCGLAIAMLPPFIVSHSFASLSKLYPTDGFSLPYQIGLGIGMFCYALFGLYLLRKILLNYFSDKVVAITLLFLITSSALLNYLAIDQAQANCFLFTLYCLIIYLTIEFYKSPKKWLAFILALLCGFATLIRPTDIICIFIPLFWGVNNFYELKQRFNFWFVKRNWIFLSVIGFVTLPSFQFFYWKYVLNEWYAYSYRDQGFSWLRPHVYQFFLSFKSGFLAYSPSMILAYVGLWRFIKNGRSRLIILFLIIISHYITTAWDVIDYGWYSGRAMIQYFPFLAFPVASLIEYISLKRSTKFVFAIYCLLAIYFNIWWTYHIHAGNTPSMNLTNVQYWSNIGRWR